MGLKREVRVSRVFVRENNLQGTAIMYNNVTACLCSLVTQYASRTKKTNNRTNAIKITSLHY